ncbi:MAG: hypothetical protein ACK47B_17010 [Armatimonadota bacterium]
MLPRSWFWLLYLTLVLGSAGAAPATGLTLPAAAELPSFAQQQQGGLTSQAQGIPPEVLTRLSQRAPAGTTDGFWPILSSDRVALAVQLTGEDRGAEASAALLRLRRTGRAPRAPPCLS